MENINKHLLDLPVGLRDTDWNEKIEYLYFDQLKSWNMAYTHYHQLKTVEKRSISFNIFRIDLQHNPTRARSTCADLSQKTIEKRPCFLCAENLPEEQKGFSLLNKYLLLVNPFPIFDRHLTISDFKHIPQNIENRIIDLLTLSKTLTDYTLFYNGPQCGASAPDHFHFQAAKKGEMPIDNEFGQLPLTKKTLLIQSEDIQITQIEDYLRNALVFESKYIEPIDYFFAHILHRLPFDKISNEPMINILASYQNGIYTLTLFPRKKQRPSSYFLEDPHRILVSPASVEMGGIIITPRAEDFQKINMDDLRRIYKETSLEITHEFINSIKNDL